MINVCIGKDKITLNDFLPGELEIFDAKISKPEEMMSLSIFNTPKLIKNYTSWTVSERKRFYKLDNDLLEIYVEVDKLGKTDPINSCLKHNFDLPDKQWKPWVKKRAEKYNLNLKDDQITYIITHLNQDPYAIETELEKIAITGNVSLIENKSDIQIWNWVEAIISKNLDKANTELALLKNENMFALLGAVGQRIYSQVLYFKNIELSSPWIKNKARDSKKYGWNKENSVAALKEIIDLEKSFKTDGLDQFTQLLLFQNKLLS